ncbi:MULTISPECIES: FAD-dependent monooxygenase family protein [Streptomyces]|uniref:hypothetical protein n=1 Tax=Streptomyces TaxID=1883 RepID=UPI00102EB779|nr:MULTISPECIES: hypothetical protein [Streptomyces]MYS66463.1 hypothetical protein [Streptomyces sp. SID5473]TAI41584.1 hypothetical protein EWI31_27580 [Streptomyces tsukubensis]
MSPAQTYDGIVIGGGFTGALAALASIRGGNHVLLLTGDKEGKADEYANTPHLLPWGSLHDADTWAPGLGAQLLDAGASPIPLPEGLVSSGAPAPRWGTSHPKVLSCTRQLFRTTLHANLAMEHGFYGHLSVRNGTAVGLLGSRREVTGVRVNFDDGATEEVHAPLVVDCSGRSSAADWLTALGLPPTRQTTQRAALTYTQQEYELPGMPSHIVWNPSMILAPVEDRKWVLTCSTEASVENPASWRTLSAGISHIAQADPVGDPDLVRIPPRRIHHYDEQLCWPRGFLVLGDAVGTQNPLNGTDAEIAQAMVETFHQELCRGGIAHPTLAERTQAAVNHLSSRAWGLPVEKPTRNKWASARKAGREVSRPGIPFRWC